MSDHVLIIGATLLDTKGKPIAGLDNHTSNPAHIRSTRGGTARNVAENLALLGADVILISAVGDDPTGRQLIEPTAAAGVDVDHVVTVSGKNSGAYIALLDPDGSLSVALDDVTVMEAITADYLLQHEALFRDAAMIMMDGSLQPDAMKTVVSLAQKYHIPLCADPSSARLAHKLRPFLPQLHLVVPNEQEAMELCQIYLFADGKVENLDLAQELMRRGVETAIVTLADFGLDYATSDEMGYIPPSYSEQVDSTGTGDAVTAAVMFGMLNQLSTVESIRLGAAAASLTLQTGETVVPDLSLDMLYEHLIV